MERNWWNPWTWPSFNGSYDNSIPVETGNINGTPAVMYLDVINGAYKGATHYHKNFRKYVELQKEVFVVNNAIGKIANVFSKAEFTGDSKILDKINNPNIKQSKQEFLKEFCVFIKAAGWAIIWKRWESVGNFDTLQLINIDPDKADFTTNGKLQFEYEGISHTVELVDVILFYDTIREKDGKGYSAMRPLKSQIDNVLNAQRAKGIQIENSGTTIVSPKVSANAGGMPDNGLDALVHPDIEGQISQKQQIEEKLNNRGIANRIIVASKGLDAQNLSAELNNFDFHSKVEADILAIYDAFGVPVELTPYGKNVTYENKSAAELGFLQSEVMPLAESLANSLNSEFEAYGQVEVNFDSLEAMTIVKNREQDTKSKMINDTIALVSSGIVTTDEARKLLNGIIQ